MRLPYGCYCFSLSWRLCGALRKGPLFHDKQPEWSCQLTDGWSCAESQNSEIIKVAQNWLKSDFSGSAWKWLENDTKVTQKWILRSETVLWKQYSARFPSMGHKAPWKLGMLICNFATAHFAGEEEIYYLLVTSRPPSLRVTRKWLPRRLNVIIQKDTSKTEYSLQWELFT